MTLVTLQAFDDFVLETHYERECGAVIRRWCAEHMAGRREIANPAGMGEPVVLHGEHRPTVSADMLSADKEGAC